VNGSFSTLFNTVCIPNEVLHPDGGRWLACLVDGADETLVMTQQLLLLAKVGRCDVQITGIDDATAVKEAKRVTQTRMRHSMVTIMPNCR
jgi:hypothetical protein